MAQAEKWVVWSFDETEEQTFVDIVTAPDKEAAAARVMRGRPYATLDRYVEPMLLRDHIAALQRELENPDDGFAMIEAEQEDECDCADRSWYGDRHDSACPLAGRERK